jgi:hypothetical protein
VSSAAGADPYLDPVSGVLRNRLGITGASELAQVEAALTVSRLIDLERRRLPGRYDLAHLQAFHRYIFGDIYAWAGELRTVAIARSDVFCLPQHLQSSATAWTLRRTPPPAWPHIAATSPRCRRCSRISSTRHTLPDHPVRSPIRSPDPARIRCP